MLAFCFFSVWQSVTCNQGPSIANQRKPFIKLHEDRGGRTAFLDFDSLNVIEKGESLLDSSVGRWRNRLGLLRLCLTELQDIPGSSRLLACLPLPQPSARVHVCFPQLPTHYTTPCCAFQASHACSLT